MRLVFVTQVVDADDVNLASTVDKLRALARRCDELVVVCARVGRHDLPAHVSFRSFGAPTRVRRGARYLAAVLPLLARRRDRFDALVAHMCPIYLVLAAPLAKPLRVPLVIWYTHWTIDWTLRWATRLADRALSVDRRSYPLDSPKVRGIGHGIDTDRFAPADGGRPAAGRLRLLALGRTSPSKGFVTLLEAFARAAEEGLDATLELRGPALTAEERRHRAELERLASRPTLTGRVSLEPPVPRPRVPELVRAAHAVVNPTVGQTHGGALDKVVYEAAACGVPVIACNPHFDDFLGGLPLELRFRSGDPADLARVLREFADTTPAVRAEAGRELRRRVEQGHSIETWADGVVREAAALRA